MPDARCTCTICLEYLDVEAFAYRHEDGFWTGWCRHCKAHVRVTWEATRSASSEAAGR